MRPSDSPPTDRSAVRDRTRDPRRRPGFATGTLRPLLPAGGVALLAVVLILEFGLPPAGPTAGTAVWAGPGVFSNQVLNVSGSSGSPTLAVSAANDTYPFGLNVSFREIDEYRGSGQVLARANLARANWTVTNSSSTAGLAREYRSLVPETRTNNSAQLAVVAFYVNITLFAGSGVVGAAARAATVTLALVGWVPVHSTDFLSLSLPVAPLDPAIEHLANGPADTLYCVPNGTSAAAEFLQWDPAGSLQNGSGTVGTVPTAVQIAGSPEQSTLSVAFDDAFGSRLAYGFQLGLAQPSPTAAVPLLEGLVAVGIAAVGAVVLVTLAGRNRSVRVAARPERRP